MGKLHEILAVENDRKNTAEKILEEAKTTFTKRSEHFTGIRKTYKPDAETEAQLEQPEDIKPMVETVMGKLDYTAKTVADYLDVVYQKENANTKAKADLTLEDGTVLEKDVPATMLLTLEKKLMAVRDTYTNIPTLLPGEDWKKNDEGYWESIEKKVRTVKTMKNHIKAPATDKHPAQVELFTVDERVGLATTVKTSSVLSPGDKSEMLGRIDGLLRAVKTARQRANSVAVDKVRLGEKLFKFMNYGKVTGTTTEI